jgi:hypothetical protein
MQKHFRPAPRRQYVTPRLNVYGDVRDLTLASRTNNKNDPGDGAQFMT